MTASNDNKERRPASEAPNKNDSAILGRVDNSGNERFEKEEQEADISYVDRQEGTMNNGVLGGNFDKEDA